MATAVVSIVTFLLGLLLGHRLALGRDKRKEFNEAALPIRDWLLLQESWWQRGMPDHYKGVPSQLEMDTFVSCLSARKRDRFETILADYRAETGRGGSTAFGEMIYKDPEAVQQAISGLMPFTNRR